MKYTAAAITILAAATGAMAAPATAKGIAARNQTNSNTSGYAGFIFPTVLKNHDVVSNQNTDDVQTATVRNGGGETSTVYSLPIPAEAAGKTCSLVVFAVRDGGGVENVP